MTHHFTGTKPAQHRHTESDFILISHLVFSKTKDKKHSNSVIRFKLFLSECYNLTTTHANLGQVGHSSYHLFPVHFRRIVRHLVVSGNGIFVDASFNHLLNVQL